MIELKIKNNEEQIEGAFTEDSNIYSTIYFILRLLSKIGFSEKRY